MNDETRMAEGPAAATWGKSLYHAVGTGRLVGQPIHNRRNSRSGSFNYHDHHPDGLYQSSFSHLMKATSKSNSEVRQ